MATANSNIITIPEIKYQTILVPIVGSTSLIMHAWSVKAKRIMLEREQGKKRAKEVRDPQAEYEASMYRTADGGYGFPASGFKKAMVRAGQQSGMKMTEVRQMVFVYGDPSADGDEDLVPILGEPRMREDMVRVSMSTDLRYRAEFPQWRALLKVKFSLSSVSADSVMALIANAGQTVGVGEWRPERSGQHGMFEVDSSKEVQVLG